MKTKECKECLGIMEKSFDVNNAPIWICRCCGTVTVRKIYNTKNRIDKINKDNQLNEIMRDLLK